MVKYEINKGPTEVKAIFRLSNELRYEGRGAKRIRHPRSPCSNAEFSMLGECLVFTALNVNVGFLIESNFSV